jgi:hypothetical protein
MGKRKKIFKQLLIPVSFSCCFIILNKLNFLCFQPSPFSIHSTLNESTRCDLFRLKVKLLSFISFITKCFLYKTFQGKISQKKTNDLMLTADFVSGFLWKSICEKFKSVDQFLSSRFSE